MRQTRKQRGGEVVTCSADTVDELIRQIRKEDPGRVAIMRKAGYKFVGEVVNFDIDDFAKCLESSSPLLLTIRDEYSPNLKQFMFTINSDNVKEFNFDTVGMSKARQKTFNISHAKWKAEYNAYLKEKANAAAATVNKLAETGNFKPNIVNGIMKCPRCGAVEGGTTRYIAHDYNCPFKGLKPVVSGGKKVRKYKSRKL